MKRFCYPVIMAMLVGGCAAGVPTPGNPPEGWVSVGRVNGSRDYYNVLNQWTKTLRIYEGLESRLYVHATYKGMAWRNAFIDEYARRYRLSEEIKNAMMEREMETHRLYNEFFISAYTPTDEWNDFDGKDSIWKLYLADGVRDRLDAMEIKKIDSKDPVHREFFPFLDAWSSGYVVKFPRYDSKGAGPVGEDTSSALTLIIAGVKGRGELVWQLNPDLRGTHWGTHAEHGSSGSEETGGER